MSSGLETNSFASIRCVHTVDMYTFDLVRIGVETLAVTFGELCQWYCSAFMLCNYGQFSLLATEDTVQVYPAAAPHKVALILYPK